MPKASANIQSLFRIPERFVRSVQLERDFSDPAALDDYIATPAVADAFTRIVEGLRPNAGRRAWRITGDYGVGKSSFALVVAQLLAGGQTKCQAKLAEGFGLDARANQLSNFWPILVTGSRQSMVSNLARAVGEVVVQRRPAKGKGAVVYDVVASKAAEVERSGNATDLEALLSKTRALASAAGHGVLLVVDELGKFLEHAAQGDDAADVFVLQRLAEMAARSGSEPFLLLTLLHQGFHAYAEKLPTASRNEWEKVAGRFEEIVFDQPLAHMAALVAGALRVETDKLPPQLHKASAKIGASTATMGWLAGGTIGAAALDITRLYPIHPTVLPVLVRFFARFGQHERSLFGFLLSNEPFGLQSFASRQIEEDSWYRLDDLYDYVRACFGHRLAGASYRSQWIRIVATIDTAEVSSEIELRLLKAIAVLNLIDAEDLLPTDRALAACFSPGQKNSVDTALAALAARGAVFRRGVAGGYRLWPNASVNLETTLDKAGRAIGEIQNISAALIPHLSIEPIMARRHYLETGTLRYFEVCYCRPDEILERAERETRADGLLIIALSDSKQATDDAAKIAKSPQIASRDDLVLCLPATVEGLANELQDLLLWTWVAQNTPELAEDAYAASEVTRQVSLARRNVMNKAEQLIGLRQNNMRAKCMWKGGEVEQRKGARGISATLSNICDSQYKSAPLLTNELLNRNVLSSAAAAARMRLIERLFNSAEEKLVGLDPDKTPPEKSIYLSVLKAGRVHVETGSGYKIVLPGKQDPLRLSPALKKMHELIEQGGGDRVKVAEIFAILRQPPFGVRDGVIPLLLAILLRTNAHELAVYEHGTFLHRFGPTDFQRLIKAPHYFEVQHCQISGVRLEVFDALVKSFANDQASKRTDLLEVVRPLCQFAAQLPEHTKKSSGLSDTALAVRDALLDATEPLTLLFEALPAACGISPFKATGGDAKSARRFADKLQDAIDELRHTYDGLLVRIQDRTAEALGLSGGFDRVELAQRAARVSLAAREPRLRTFALRLRDPGITDTAWAEALGSYVVSKPPSKWLASDEARFIEEAGSLSEHFCKTEAAAFSDPKMEPRPNAVRLNMTRGNGEDLVCIVEGTQDENITGQADLFGKSLPQDATLRRRLLAELLWRDMKADPHATLVAQTGPDDAKGAA